jgi:hypothetical protein
MAALASIVLIVLLTAWNIGEPGTHRSEPVSLVTGNVIAQDAPTAYTADLVDGAPLEPLALTIAFNGGTIPVESTVLVDESAITFADHAGYAHALRVTILGSQQAQRAHMTLSPTSAADTTRSEQPYELVATREETGEWSALVTAQGLAAIRARNGPGWYVFSADVARGNERALASAALFIP